MYYIHSNSPTHNDTRRDRHIYIYIYIYVCVCVCVCVCGYRIESLNYYKLFLVEKYLRLTYRDFNRDVEFAIIEKIEKIIKHYINSRIP